jgi:hypothetical protein
MTHCLELIGAASVERRVEALIEANERRFMTSCMTS